MILSEEPVSPSLLSTCRMFSKSKLKHDLKANLIIMSDYEKNRWFVCFCQLAAMEGLKSGTERLTHWLLCFELSQPHLVFFFFFFFCVTRNVGVPSRLKGPPIFPQRAQGFLSFHVCWPPQLSDPHSFPQKPILLRFIWVKRRESGIQSQITDLSLKSRIPYLRLQRDGYEIRG